MSDFLDELVRKGEEEDNEKDGTQKLPSREDIDSLRQEIDALNKEKHGLLKDVKSERARRQEITGKLNQLTETVNSLLERRQSAAAELDAGLNAQKSDKLPVTWNDDGEGFIETEQINKLLTPYQQRIAELEQQIQNSSAATSADMAAEKVRQAILGEDERYEGVYRKYQAARKWVVDQVTDFVRENNVGRKLTSGEALDYVFTDENLANEFKSAFPKIDLADIVTAEDSQHHLRRTLGNMASSLNEDLDAVRNRNAKETSRFQKVLEKPSGLGNSTNAKAGEVSVLDKIQDLSPQDLMDLDDRTLNALMKAIADEEKADGVRFK